MENLLGGVLAYLMKTFSATFSQLFVLFGPGILLTLIMYFVSGFAQRQAAGLFGTKFFIYLTAIGTVIHELGHVVFAVLFRHQITGMRLFGLDESSGTLGYVNHAYRPNSLYQNIGNFFIGIGPVILGPLVIFLSATWMPGGSLFQSLDPPHISTDTFTSLQNAAAFIGDVFVHAWQMLGMLFRGGNFSNPWFYLFIYLVFAVGVHVKLSPSDLQGAWSGFVFVMALFFIFNLLTLWLGDFSIQMITLVSQSYVFFYAYMLFTMLLILIFMGFMMLLSSTRRLFWHR